MAEPSTRNVAAAKPAVGGGVLYAPLGTALPSDASTALDAAFVPLGYISDDGVEPDRSTDTEKIKAWGGDVIAALVSDDSRSFKFTVYETYYAAVQKFVYGDDNVTATAAGAGVGSTLTVLDKATKPDDCVLVFEMKFGDKKRRVVVPNADSSVTGEGPWQDNALSSYEITCEALKDDAGVRVYDYMVNDDATA